MFDKAALRVMAVLADTRRITAFGRCFPGQRLKIADLDDPLL